MSQVQKIKMLKVAKEKEKQEEVVAVPSLKEQMTYLISCSLL